MTKILSLTPLVFKRCSANFPKNLVKKPFYAKPAVPRSIELDGRSIIEALKRINVVQK